VPHLVQDLVHAAAARRIEFGMQAHVEQREFHLPQRLQPGLEAARRDQLALLVGRDRPAVAHVRRDAIEDLALPGVVLHELAGQFDRVPGHAVDAGQARVVHAREHVVQAVAELVEQRHDIVVRELRRRSSPGGIELHTR
jgi:hypothetical protein